jgi:hypothetical protein
MSHTVSIPFSHRGWLAAASVGGLLLTGCVFDSPYWAQTFATTTTAVPIQTWTTDKTRNIKIECSQASHAGLYPWGGPEVWTLVTNITPSTNASYDPLNGTIYSAGKLMSLPAACWHADGAYSPPKYMTALRATQLTASGSTQTYQVFDAGGLECLGREIGKGKSWFAWITKNCALTYSGSTTPIPYVRIIATDLGMAAMAAPAPMARALPAPTDKTTAPAPDTQTALLAKAFAAEPVDAAWAAPLEARLRAAFDKAHPAGTELNGLACRSSLCRVEVAHVDATAQWRFAAAMGPLGLFSNDGRRGAVAHGGEGDALTSVYFIAREGQELPGGTAVR